MVKSEWLYRFSVFTPTYNRAHTLPRVYQSLKRQTFRDFEWLVVDDGSTDGTKELVADWQKEASFPIRYFWQENQHKKTAFNRGVREARGELFLPLDSDDECVPHALERFYWHWSNIPLDRREGFSAITALCVDENGKIVGDRFPGGDYIDSDSLEIRYRYGIRGEKWGFHRTEVLRQYPFPEDVKGHVPEGVVWSAIARKYKTRFINEALRIYHQQGADRLTQGGGGVLRNAHGHFIWMDSILENEICWFWYKPAWFFKVAINWTRFGWHAGRITKRHLAEKEPAVRALLLAMFPLGLLRVVFDKLKLGITR